MRKRKSEDSEETIRNKIKKLEVELHKRKEKKCTHYRRYRVISSSSEDENYDPNVGENAYNVAAAAETSSRSTPASEPFAFAPSATAPTVPVQLVSVPPTPPALAPAPPPPQSSPPVEPSMSQTEPQLDEEILRLLGDPPQAETLLGPNIHKHIAMRWQEILTKGLPKDVKEKLLKDYLVPGNCDLLVPPILNPEVKAALPESLVKRDIMLLEKQKQIGIAVAALAKATDMLISKDAYANILKSVSDACRILCDTLYNETKTRRSFVISATNTNLKDTLLEAKRDKYLFGDNMADKLKSAKTIQKSGTDLKQNQKNAKFNKANFYKSKPLNTRALHRRTGSKTADAGRTRPGLAAQARAARGPPHASARPYTRPRSPPPPPPPLRRSQRLT